jgi:prefoldin subunit 5
MQSTHNQIENAIKKKGRGKIFFTEDFIVFGTNVAVRHTLSRLCKDELIVHLSAGIYLYPKIDEQIGVLYPSIEAIPRQSPNAKNHA